MNTQTTTPRSASRYLSAAQVGEVLSTLGMQIAVNLSQVLSTIEPDGTVAFHTSAGTIRLSLSAQEGGAA